MNVLLIELLWKEQKTADHALYTWEMKFALLCLLRNAPFNVGSSYENMRFEKSIDSVEERGIIALGSDNE